MRSVGTFCHRRRRAIPPAYGTALAIGPGSAERWIRHCIFYGNQEGGGTQNVFGTVAVYEQANVFLVNSHFGCNAAQEGGGLYIRDSNSMGSLVAVNCTFNRNAADLEGGAIGAHSGVGAVLRLTNDILWENFPDDLESLGLLSLAEYTCSIPVLPGIGNIAADPLLEPAGMEFHILEGSPCIDAGTASLPDGIEVSYDLDGRPREKQGGSLVNVDIGADEYGNVVPEDVWRKFVRGDADADGRIDLGDPITILNYIFASGPEPPCLDAADADNEVEEGLTIADPIYILNWMYSEGPPMPYPRPSSSEFSPEDCGYDTGSPFDVLDCKSFPPCP